MKNPKVNYKIKRENFQNHLDITVEITEIEKLGLKNYLINEKLIHDNDNFEILNRFVVLPSLKRVITKNPQEDVTKFIKKKSYSSYENNINKKFRVNLHSVEFYAQGNYPKYVDIETTTRGKAIMIAQNKVGLTEFPEGWNNMRVENGDIVENFGIYSLGDENNVYKKREQQTIHQH